MNMSSKAVFLSNRPYGKDLLDGKSQDYVAVEDKKIGLSASTDEKESWSTKTARLLKWTCAVIVALGALIIIIRVCYHR